MQVGEAQRDFRAVEPGLGFGKPAVFALPEVECQVSSFHEIHDKIKRVLVVKGVPGKTMQMRGESSNHLA